MRAGVLLASRDQAPPFLSRGLVLPWQLANLCPVSLSFSLLLPLSIPCSPFNHWTGLTAFGGCQRSTHVSACLVYPYAWQTPLSIVHSLWCYSILPVSDIFLAVIFPESEYVWAQIHLWVCIGWRLPVYITLIHTLLKITACPHNRMYHKKSHR